MDGRDAAHPSVSSHKKERLPCDHEFHTAPTPHFQGTFFLAAHGISKGNLSIRAATQENLESTFLHPKYSFH